MSFFFVFFFKVNLLQDGWVFTVSGHFFEHYNYLHWMFQICLKNNMWFEKYLTLDRCDTCLSCFLQVMWNDLSDWSSLVKCSWSICQIKTFQERKSVRNLISIILSKEIFHIHVCYLMCFCDKLRLYILYIDVQ